MLPTESVWGNKSTLIIMRLKPVILLGCWILSSVIFLSAMLYSVSHAELTTTLFVSFFFAAYYSVKVEKRKGEINRFFEK
ncbi:hypothetical protein IX296_000984 [Bacteroides pyogenes]|nr:hypothetical protein [Bacteroides pyogenes]MBR8753911.1 hypothetical protein [Bacteroides pyogenes]MBR8808705.1 hypothetical protein [Bacteroides pyogenes]